MSYETFKAVNQAQFRKFSKGFASAKDNLQTALGAAIYQAIVLDNPNWLTELFELAAFWLSPVNGKHQVSSDGRLIYAYVTEGLGLGTDILKLDRETKKWELVKGRKLALEDIDLESVWTALENIRFDTWGKGKKEKPAYTPVPALDRIQKALAKKDTELDQETLKTALAQARAIEKALMAKIRPEKATIAPKTVALPEVPELSVAA